MVPGAFSYDKSAVDKNRADGFPTLRFFPEQSESEILLVAFSPKLKVFVHVRDIAGDERILFMLEAESCRCRLFYVDFEKSWSSRSKIPPSSALRAARMYLLVSSGSTLRRAAVAPSSMGHSR